MWTCTWGALMSERTTVGEVAKNLTMIGDLLFTGWRLLLHQKKKIPLLLPDERDEVLVMAWRARKKLVKLAEELDKFEEDLYDEDEQKPVSIVEKVKGRFWSRRPDRIGDRA